MRSPVHLVLVAFLLAGCGRPEIPPGNPEITSWRSLLRDAADFELTSVGASRLYSSGSAPVSLTGFSPKNYGDLDHGNFLSVKEVPGGFEAVLAEADGAGAITWVWSANPVGTLILEIDGTVVEQPFESFLQGKWLPKRDPFAVKTSDGFNLHFPIIHQKQCKVSVRAESRAELGALFYQLAWSGLAGEVEPFDMASVSSHRKTLGVLSNHWKKGRDFHSMEMFRDLIPAGQPREVVRLDGAGEVQCLEMTAGSKKQLSDLWIELYWDGVDKPALACPLYMLCGVSEYFEDVESLPVTVDGKTAVLRWPMPFSEGARVRLTNRGTREVMVRVAVAQEHNRKSQLRLGGQMTGRENLAAEEKSVVTLADVDGAGYLVGCILQVDNRSDGWWGEGDPIIWLDTSDRPVWRGTGTEDYFGFAWCSKAAFQHPLRGQTRAGLEGACMYRYHLLDTLPFHDAAQFNFEMHGIGSGLLDYSALVLWYSSTDSIND